MVRIEVQCEVCGKTFWREKGEISRSRRLGRKLYCSRQCTGIANTRNFPPRDVRMKNLRRGSIPDDYSPFREYLKLARRRTQERGETTPLTLEDLKQQWESQDGTCPLTGWVLELPPTSNWATSPLTPRRASLDRIDSSQGYVPGNVRFISVIGNYCKHVFTDADVIAFCHAVAERFPPPDAE
jgi:hypothetical protein